MQGSLVRSLVTELGSHMPRGAAKTRKVQTARGWGTYPRSACEMPRDFSRREIRRMKMCHVHPVQYYSGAKKGWSADMRDHADKPWNTLTERSQTQNDTCYIFHLYKMSNFMQMHICIGKSMEMESKLMTWWLPGAWWGHGGPVGRQTGCLKSMIFILGWGECSGIVQWWWLHNLVNILRTIH